MDSFTTSAKTRHAANNGERGRQLAERLFLARGEASEIPGLLEAAPGSPRPGRGHVGKRAGALALGVCAIAFLVYGLERPSGNSRGTVTEVLPAATSGRAVMDLPPPDLLRPLSPEEASKENAGRPFVSRPDTPASRFVLRTEAEDHSRAVTCLAQAVYYEAASEGMDGGRAVAQVVLNRLHHPGFPSTICGVVYQGGDRMSGCQFSFVCDGSMQRIPVPSLWIRSREIAEQALSGKVFALVGHATHYHADYVLPYWADSLDKTVQVGRHIFYRLRGAVGDSRGFSQRYGGTEPQVRVPGAVIVIPPAAVTPQLANALISDGVEGLAKDAQKASPQPSSPLLVDSTLGTLLADSSAAAQRPAKAKASSECGASADRKQLAPLGANDIRSSAAGNSC